MRRARAQLRPGPPPVGRVGVNREAFLRTREAEARANAAEMINMWALAVSKRLGLRDMAGYVAPYPTMSEIGKRAGFKSRCPQGLVGSSPTRRTQRALALQGDGAVAPGPLRLVEGAIGAFPQVVG